MQLRRQSAPNEIGKNREFFRTILDEKQIIRQQRRDYRSRT